MLEAEWKAVWGYVLCRETRTVGLGARLVRTPRAWCRAGTACRSLLALTAGTPVSRRSPRALQTR